MKKIFIAIPLLALAACGSSFAGSMPDGEEITTSAADPGKFSGVSLLGPDNIIFETGDDYSVRAEGDADIIEKLRYELDGEQLKIGRKRHKMSWGGHSDSVTIYVTAPSLRAAKIAGSGNLEADQISGDDAELSVAGAGDIKIATIDAESLSAKVTGSGDMNLAGTTENLNAKVTGSGKISGKELKAEEATLKVTGSGDLVMSSDGTVNAKVTGSGDIRVHGNAKCTSKITGSGEVTCG